MSDIGFSQGGWGVEFLGFMPLPWSSVISADDHVNLPPLIKQSVEESKNIEVEVTTRNGYVSLCDEENEIISKLKNSLTVSQFEQLHQWRQMLRDNFSRKHEHVYFDGVRIGIAFAKQCESIGGKEGLCW